MTDKEKSKVLNALYSYDTFKSCVKHAVDHGGVIVYDASGGSSFLTERELLAAIKIAEDTLTYFDLQDDTKGVFIRRLFFKRERWVKIERELCISRGTIQNWRSEAIKIAEKIARKNGFI